MPLLTQTRHPMCDLLLTSCIFIPATSSSLCCLLLSVPHLPSHTNPPGVSSVLYVHLHFHSGLYLSIKYYPCHSTQSYSPCLHSLILLFTSFCITLYTRPKVFQLVPFHQLNSSQLNLSAAVSLIHIHTLFHTCLPLFSKAWVHLQALVNLLLTLWTNYEILIITSW